MSVVRTSSQSLASSKMAQGFWYRMHGAASKFPPGLLDAGNLIVHHIHALRKRRWRHSQPEHYMQRFTPWRYGMQRLGARDRGRTGTPLMQDSGGF